MLTGALVVVGLWAVVATAAALVLGRALVVAEHRERERRGLSTPAAESERPPVAS